MKKTLFIGYILLLALKLEAQDDIQINRYSLKVGAGSAFLGSGDMVTVSMENELNYYINNHFSTSLGAAYGKSEYGVYVSSSYLQGNLNLLWSPWGHNSKHNFKVGTGFSFMNISDFYKESDVVIFNYIDDDNFGFSRRYAYGYNIVLEYDYLLTSKYLLGLKLFTQNYFNGDISTGGFVRFGILL